MFPKSRETYAVKRFLLAHKGIVIPMHLRGNCEAVDLPYPVVYRVLQRLTTAGHVERHGNWQHLWFLVTPEGDQVLRNEVGSLEESQRDEPIAIKN